MAYSKKQIEEFKKEFYEKYVNEYKATCEHYIYLGGSGVECWKWIEDKLNKS